MSTSLNQYWSVEHQEQIKQTLETAKEGNLHPFAVFDADNTIWKYDLAESLLAWMSVSGAIVMAEVEQNLLPVPPRDGETLISYYDHLCDIDHSLAYLWSAQIFSGRQMDTLRVEVEKMLASEEDILAPMPEGRTKVIPVPRIFPAQQELISFLQENGIEVWVVSASLEEVVRMVASDPRYGINIPPERVIGVNLMLEKPDGSVTVGALERQEGKVGLDYYFSEERMQWTLSTYPFAPMTWYGGKVAAISEWIDPAQRPILVGGDSPNDFYMQFYAAVDEDGIRLRIHRTDEHKEKLEEQKVRRQNGNVNQDPQKGWLEVSAEDLGL